MSRTKRNKRPQMNLGKHLGKNLNDDGTVRDGTPTHYSRDCQHHGGCPYCLRDRMHSNTKREPIDGYSSQLDTKDLEE